jgi:prevent-host-death family protein
MSRGRVLIVDDEPSVLKLYSRTLSRAGFDVTPAASGLEALQRMEKGKFDVVLSDLAMPKMDGLALLGQMRARSLEQPVILMLDAPDNRAAIRATELGAIQSLIKPITAALLQETAGYAAELHRSRRSIPAKLRTVHRDSLGAAPSITATVAKNEFGRVLEKVLHGGFMVITKHDDPKAVLISVDEFNEISNAPGLKLDTLSGEFDALLASMQRPEARAGMKGAFGASPKQLGQAAVAAARRRA